MRESSLLWAYRPWIPWKSKEHIFKVQERWVPSDSFLKFWPPNIQASLDSLPYLLTLHNQNRQINSLFPLCLELFKRRLLSRESNALSNPLFTPTAAKISVWWIHSELKQFKNTSMY
jgi:hypothetical protein